MRLPDKVTVDVTQDDIDDGVISNEHCPIALAFRRATDTLGVSVDPWRIDAMEPACGGAFPVARIVSYCLPQDATDFIKAFDENQPVGPFSFEVTR